MEKSPIEKGPRKIECTPERIEDLRQIFLKKLQENYGQSVELQNILNSGERKMDIQQQESLSVELGALAERIRTVHKNTEEKLAA